MAVLAASDVAALSSRSESRPHALSGERGCGPCPSSATDVPGIRVDALGEHQAPYLAPPEDPARLDRGARRADLATGAEDGELGRENRRNARESASDPGPATVELISRALAR